MALIIHSFETYGNVSCNKHNSFELDIFKPWNYSCLLDYYHDFNSMDRCGELCIIVIECRKKTTHFTVCRSPFLKINNTCEVEAWIVQQPAKSFFN